MISLLFEPDCEPVYAIRILFEVDLVQTTTQFASGEKLELEIDLDYCCNFSSCGSGSLGCEQKNSLKM